MNSRFPDLIVIDRAEFNDVLQARISTEFSLIFSILLEQFESEALGVFALKN